MSYLALYRKYRPKKFDEIVGQETVVRILKNSIQSNKIGHAYLFCGPKGTGKTSTAKIFSRAVNCLNQKNGDVCGECDICKNFFENNIDIIEIDAASNNGVDEIREIRNSVSLMPSFMKYKVYIIDEVHMLSMSAFNALLKTLEEPPEHVIFILATTEINKVPATVLSRCQKIDFKKIPPKSISKQLKKILEFENKSLSDDVINLISELSDGAFRDAINLLDQVITFNNENVSVDDVYELIGDVTNDTIFSLIRSIINYDIKSGLEIINNLFEKGKNFFNVSNKLQSIIRDIIINNSTHDYFKKEYELVLDEFSDISSEDCLELSSIIFDLNMSLKKAPNQKILFETYFIKMTLIFSKAKYEKEKVSSKIVESDFEKNYSKNNFEEDIKDDEKKINQDDSSNKNIIINNAFAEANKELKIDFVKKYNDINDYISNKDFNSIANLMLKAIPEVVSARTVLFSFKNYFEVVLFDKNYELIQKLLKKIYSNKYEIVAVDNEKWDKIKVDYTNKYREGVKLEYKDASKKIIKKKTASALENEVENIFGDDIVSVE